MNNQEQYLVFGLHGSRLALSLGQVQRVVRAAAVTPVPDPPPGLRGVINVAGQIVPVLDLRQFLHFPVEEIRPSDYFILVQHASGRVALLVNEVLWIISRGPEDIVPASHIFPGLAHIRGAVKMDQEIILIHDLADQELPTLSLQVGQP
ncbi:MAG: chemotaxis protein CheW [Desulfobacca sp.]|uniref:chemotaxis protein CheW n=1 Tax=Desulfobacca sp. TaxID=2067990 RepID=UPI0040493D18